MMNKIVNYIVVSILTLLSLTTYSQSTDNSPIYPTDIAVDSNLLYLTSRAKKSLLIYDNDKLTKEIALERSATGVTFNDKYIFATASHERGFLYKIEKSSSEIVASVETGMGARSPIISSDGKSVFVANQFKNSVSKIDLASFTVVAKVKVKREPFSLAISPNGEKLFVANFLPLQAANLDYVASDVSIIDTKSMSVITDVKLSNGSNALRDIATTKDGKYVLVSHNLGRFQVPTSQLQQGWMNTSAMSIIDAETNQFIGSVLLDKPERGYAGIWGIESSDDKIFVSHSGVHEITIIDYPKLVEKLASYQNKENLSIDLNFLYGINRRVKVEGNGPRTLHLKGEKLYAISYFSDIINQIDINSEELIAININKNRKEGVADEGERIFNDAAFCFQQWQSCNGCHPGDGRTDGMNWDLMNDGVGNPKNCKSLLYSHDSPPSMISGIRNSAELAVRKGFTFIQFSQISEEDATKVDEYLKTLKALPSPHLQKDGSLSPLADQGRKVFEDRGCSECHSGPLYTDMKMHHIGENVEFDKGWDTPTLREVWRTGPYLFDGRAVTMEEVFSTYKHGIEGKLSKKDLAALVEYVNSL